MYKGVYVLLCMSVYCVMYECVCVVLCLSQNVYVLCYVRDSKHVLCYVRVCMCCVMYECVCVVLCMCTLCRKISKKHAPQLTSTSLLPGAIRRKVAAQ